MLKLESRNPVARKTLTLPVALLLLWLSLISLAPLLSAEAKEIPHLTEEPLDASHLGDEAFRDLVIFNHLDEAAAANNTIGVEVELGGLSGDQVAEEIHRKFGGQAPQTIDWGTEHAILVKGTKIGDIRIEPVNLMRQRNKLAEEGHKLAGTKLAEKAVGAVDKVFGTVEIVLPPLKYAQVKEFAPFLDHLSALGAKGTSDFGRLVSEQINIGVNPNDAGLIKRALANYYRNKKPIRDDVRPSRSRQFYVQDITPEFQAKLEDPSWNPDIHELFREYEKGSQRKWARLNAMHALLMDPENKANFVQPEFNKEIPGRPVVEFREPNTVMSTAKDPTLASRSLMREVDFSLALMEGSKNHGDMSLETERARAAARESLRAPTPLAGTLRENMSRRYYTPLEVKPVSGAQMVMGNAELLDRWGIRGTPEEVAEEATKRFGVAVDNSQSHTGTISENPKAPFATEHFDGYGGVGDGRALVVAEHQGHAINSKGGGLTPYVLKGYATTLGFHIGGVDGKASLAEGVRSYIIGEALDHIGIPSERIASLIDNNAVSSSEMAGTQPSAIITRDLPGGGVRNSHLRAWDKTQIRRGMDYMKDIVSAETGHKVTDQVFMAMDAQRSAQIAARMQDQYVVHGALTSGNVLAYPGVVDLNTVAFLEVPDPEYTPIAMNSRYGKQTGRMRDLVLERQKYYAKANPGLKGVNVTQIYDTAFKRELSLLNLERLGISRELGARLIDKNPGLTDRYSDLLWKEQTGHLHTDMRKFQALAVQRAAEAKSDPARVAREILAQTTDDGRTPKVARRKWVQDAYNIAHGRLSGVAAKNAEALLGMQTALLDEAAGLAEQSGASRQAFLADAAKTAAAKAEFRLPSPTEVEKAVQAVVNAKIQNRSIQPGLDMARQLVANPAALVGKDPVGTNPALAYDAERAADQIHIPRFLGEQTNPERMMADMREFTGEAPNSIGATLSNRFSTENKAVSRQMIMAKLKEMGLETRIEASPSHGGLPCVNLIADIKGTKDPKSVIEIVAHYDSRTPIVTGADDNASGLVSALEIARAQAKAHPDKTIRFVFSDNEERGLLGSDLHVQNLVNGDEKLEGAYILDMISHNHQKGRPEVDLVAGNNPESQALANRLMHQQARYKDRPLKSFPITTSAPQWVADHGPYWDRRQPAIFVREAYADFTPHYHTPRDVTATVNQEYLGNVTRMVNESVAALAGSKVPQELEGEYMARVPAYNAVFDPNVKADRNFVKEAKPVRGMVARALTMDWRPLLERTKGRLQGGEGAEARRAFEAERTSLLGLIDEINHTKDEAEAAKLAANFETKAREFRRKWDVGLAPAPADGDVKDCRGLFKRLIGALAGG